MKLLTKTLCLCLLLSLAHGVPVAALPDRCEGIEFDAITPDEKGQTFFFKGAYLWEGFQGPAELSSETFKEIIGQVDAAFRMHNMDSAADHDHIYFFVGDKVFRYYNHTLDNGYPKQIQEEFPGVPTDLDAAVECPKGECTFNAVLFFKGHEVYFYDISTRTVKTKQWPHLPVCSAALRWLEHYYCFHGHNFTRFLPMGGEASGTYPKDARNYFMNCPNFGHGKGFKIPKCSEVKIDASSTDDAGKTYIFAGPIYMQTDIRRDRRHIFPINRMWREVNGSLDAVFSYSDKLYLIKGDQVYIYKSGAPYTLVQGYPKSLKEELNIEGHVDAAFVCSPLEKVYIVQGKILRTVDLTATPRAVTDLPLPISGIDAARCGGDGIVLFKGSQYYKYESILILTAGRIAPLPIPISPEMAYCVE
uniref:Hemopexin n=1 Tax=Mola mola TaxID=94237 RepID=A0A3Q3X2N2_MOLML